MSYAYSIMAIIAATPMELLDRLPSIRGDAVYDGLHFELLRPAAGDLRPLGQASRNAAMRRLYKSSLRRLYTST